MSWYNDDQTEVILSRQNRTLQIFDIRAEEFTNNREITFGNGKPHSVCVSAEIVACATESGIVKIWKKDCYDEGREMNVGSDLEKIRMTRETSNVFASGGKENELKLWDVETGKQIFLAKNLPHDWLQLRVPVWVSDMCFMENCEGKLIATCSRYGFVR